MLMCFTWLMQITAEVEVESRPASGTETRPAASAAAEGQSEQAIIDDPVTGSLELFFSLFCRRPSGLMLIVEGHECEERRHDEEEECCTKDLKWVVDDRP